MYYDIMPLTGVSLSRVMSLLPSGCKVIRVNDASTSYVWVKTRRTWASMRTEMDGIAIVAVLSSKVASDYDMEKIKKKRKGRRKR